MTAHQHHAESVIAQLVSESWVLSVEIRQRRSDLRFFAAKSLLPPQLIERPVARHAEQPARRVVRHSVEAPLRQCRDQRLLHRLLGHREMLRTEDARQRSDHLSRAMAEQMVHQDVDLLHQDIGSISRTSIDPKSRCGQPLASESASS